MISHACALVVAGIHSVYIAMYTMIPTGNRNLSHLNGTVRDDKLEAKLLGNISWSRNSVFDEMCREIDVKSYKEVRASALNRRNVTKDLLCLWLENVCCISQIHFVCLNYRTCRNVLIIRIRKS